MNIITDTALHLASECGSEGCVTLLLSSGADPNQQDHVMQTPLMAACITGHTSCIHPVRTSYHLKFGGVETVSVRVLYS